MLRIGDMGHEFIRHADQTMVLRAKSRRKGSSVGIGEEDSLDLFFRNLPAEPLSLRDKKSGFLPRPRLLQKLPDLPDHPV